MQNSTTHLCAGNHPISASQETISSNVASMLSDEPDIRRLVINYGGHHALFHCASTNRFEDLANLIVMGVDINIKNQSGESAFDIALKNSSWASLRVILDRPELNLTPQQFRNSLKAVRNLSYDNEDSLPIIDFLLNKPIEYQSDLSHVNLLKIAFHNDRIDLAEKIIENAVNINFIDNNRTTAMHVACSIPEIRDYGKKEKIFNFLINKGANINIPDNDGEVPLHKIIRDGNSNFINLLLQKGAIIDFANYEGETPLNLACKLGKLDAIKTLVENNANLNLANANGISPLMLLTDFAVEQFSNQRADGLSKSTEDLAKILDTLNFLIENGASTDLPGRRSKTIIEYLDTKLASLSVEQKQNAQPVRDIIEKSIANIPSTSARANQATSSQSLGHVSGI
jgi:ankyrin repeat protein